MIINLEEIKELLKSDITGYRISLRTDVKQQTYDKYRKGKSRIEDMTLQTAIDLQNYIDSKKELEKMVNKDKFMEDAKTEIRNQYGTDDFDYEYKLTEKQQILYVSKKDKMVAEVHKSHDRDMLDFYDSQN